MPLMAVEAEAMRLSIREALVYHGLLHDLEQTTATSFQEHSDLH